MNILFTIEQYYPIVGGAEEVVRKISERLAKKGHQVTVATSSVPERKSHELNGVKIVSFNIYGNKVRGFYGETKKYKDFLITSHFDIICNYAAQSWPTDLTLELLDKLDAKKVLFPCGYSGLVLWSKKIFYWNYFRRLPIYLGKYSHIIYHSANYIDKVFGDKHNIKHYSIIPNGIDIDEMKTHTIKFREFYNINTKYMLLNVSNHFKLKGHSFVLKSFNLLNRDDVTLVIIGNKVFGLRGCYSKCKRAASNNPRVILLENTPREHVVSAFHESNVFVFGSKVECFPLVVSEAMSVGLPFISTNVGNVRELNGGIIVNTPKEMAVCINKVLDDSNCRETLSTFGQNDCLNKYTWGEIITKYEDLFKKIVTQGSQSEFFSSNTCL